MHRVEVERADITTLKVDAIVNAANEWMLGGGGVDGAIHRAAGPELRRACEKVPEVRPGVRCPTGEARITPAFGLPSKYVIHTVGPVWRGGNSREADLLSRCYTESLGLAVKHQARSVAFPAISCGVYGYPAEKAARVATRAIASFLDGDESLERIVLVAFDERAESTLREALGV